MANISALRGVTVDCRDPRRLAEFWSETLGWTITDVDEDGAIVSDPEDRRAELFFQPVQEEKTIKNRLHFDLRPPFSRDEEVARLNGLGAIVLEGFGGPDATWVVMRDPEGNEFCVERSDGEQQSDPPAS